MHERFPEKILIIQYTCLFFCCANEQAVERVIERRAKHTGTKEVKCNADVRTAPPFRCCCTRSAMLGSTDLASTKLRPCRFYPPTCSQTADERLVTNSLRVWSGILTFVCRAVLLLPQLLTEDLKTQGTESPPANTSALLAK